MKAAYNGEGKRRTFNLQTDLDRLAKKISEIGDVAVVDIDPVTSYMGKIDGHQTTDVRAVLEPLADFATNTKVGIFGVTHPPKHASGKAINAFTGSLAFIAIARLGFFALEEPGTDRRLLLPVKNNLGPRKPGLAYRLAQRIVSNNILAPHIVWDNTPVTVTADEAIAAAADSARNASALSEAKDFLVDELADGPKPANNVLERAEALGIAERTLRRARKDLGVIASKETGDLSGSWLWRMS